MAGIMVFRQQAIRKLLFLLTLTYSYSSTAQVTKPKCPEVVFVKGGWFNMGPYFGDSPKTTRRVYVNDFYIGKYEVSNKEYVAFLNAVKADSETIESWIQLEKCNSKIFFKEGKYFVKKGYENYPVNCVTWEGAKAFCKYFGGRLPSEAEWEYAARGGQLSRGYLFSGSNDYTEVATIGKLEKCGSKKPNELGIYDMAGNLKEYCADWYWNSYPTGILLNPVNRLEPKGHPVISVRGGAYTNKGFFPVTTMRTGLLLNRRLYECGFRILIEKKDYE